MFEVGEYLCMALVNFPTFQFFSYSVVNIVHHRQVGQSAKVYFYI